jgi:uncharacterized damage-inducible protein DinB
MERRQVLPLDRYPRAIGQWLWALEQVRHRYTLRTLEHLDERLVDWEGPDGHENAIGSLLYHIADVEMGWLWGEIKGLTECPLEVQQLLDVDCPALDGKRLPRVLGVPLSEHIDRLGRSREILLEEFAGMTLEGWRQLRVEPFSKEYEVTAEWVVFHLVEHEAAHAAQISALKARGTRLLASQGGDALRGA